MRTGMGAYESGIEGAQEGGIGSQEACKSRSIDRGCAKGGTGASCETGSGAGERNEAVSAYESRSGCGNANGRGSTREQECDVGTVTIGVRAEAQISIIRCISNTQLNTLCDASYKHHNNRETLCTLSR